MNKNTVGYIVLLLVIAGAIWLILSASPAYPIPQQLVNQRVQMQITSPAFNHNSDIPLKYSCDGEDINPPLQFAEVPPGAESLVLIVDDPDAPSGTFVHWTVWNIPPTVTTVKENSIPDAGSIQGITSAGQTGFVGSCPPSGTGTHRYFFRLYALNTTLDLTPSAKRANVDAAMQGHIIAEAELIGLYNRD